MLFGAALALSACPGPDNPYAPVPEPSFDEYAVNVQPVVARRCAELGCHGRHERALTLYAVGYLRAPPAFAGTPLDEYRLSAEELAWNYDGMRARLIDTTSPEESRLLRKLLPPAGGGIEHATSFVVFETRDDPDYKAIEAWVRGGL